MGKRMVEREICDEEGCAEEVFANGTTKCFLCEKGLCYDHYISLKVIFGSAHDEVVSLSTCRSCIVKVIPSFEKLALKAVKNTFPGSFGINYAR